MKRVMANFDTKWKMRLWYDSRDTARPLEEIDEIDIFWRRWCDRWKISRDVTYSSQAGGNIGDGKRLDVVKFAVVNEEQFKLINELRALQYGTWTTGRRKYHPMDLDGRIRSPWFHMDKSGIFQSTLPHPTWYPLVFDESFSFNNKTSGPIRRVTCNTQEY